MRSFHKVLVILALLAPVAIGCAAATDEDTDQASGAQTSSRKRASKDSDDEDVPRRSSSDGGARRSVDASADGEDGIGDAATEASWWSAVDAGGF